MINFKTKLNQNQVKEYTNLALLMVCIIFIIIYSSINESNRRVMANILTTDTSLILAIVLITALSYYNIIAGFAISIMYLITILPYFMKSMNIQNSSKEGFESGKSDEDEVDLFKTLSGKGSRTKAILDKVESYKSTSKRSNVLSKLLEGEKQINKSEPFEDDEPNNVLSNNNAASSTKGKKPTKYDTHTKNDENEDADAGFELSNTTSTSNTKTTRLSSVEIKRRRFNPNDEEETNLKLTMEICDDIKNRIMYEYETVPYLKKYISTRLQEIIDLLSLTAS